MIDTSESEKTCSPVLSYFVSWSGLSSGCQIITQQGRLAKIIIDLARIPDQVLFSLFVLCSWFDCTNTQKRSEAGKKGGVNQSYGRLFCPP